MKTLDEMNLSELKAATYDQIRIFEQTRVNLDVLNKKITEWEKLEQPIKVDAEVVPNEN